MTIFTGRPLVSGDDTRTWAANFDSIAPSNTFGLLSGNVMNTAYRIPSVTIPQGSTISSATLRFKAYNSQSGSSVNTNIWLNDVDNAVAPTTYSGFNALVKTTAFTAWDSVPSWNVNNLYYSADFASAVQEVIDRVGWSSGNALQVMVLNDSSSNNAYRQGDTVDLGEGTAALLTINYTEPLVTSAVKIFFFS